MYRGGVNPPHTKEASIMVLKCKEEFEVEVDNGVYLGYKNIEVGTLINLDQLEIVNTIELDSLNLTILLSFDELFRYFDIILM